MKIPSAHTQSQRYKEYKKMTKFQIRTYQNESFLKITMKLKPMNKEIIYRSKQMT